MVSALMEFYKNGNQVEAMEKYLNDNERFNELYSKSKSIDEKRRILDSYIKFQLEIHRLMFGEKYSVDEKIKQLNMNIEASGDTAERLLKLVIGKRQTTVYNSNIG